MANAAREADDRQEARRLIARCCAGDAEAWREFQNRYGELIYGYPMRVYRIPAEDSADFYVFAFADGRLFRRVRSYAGRAPFRAYLLGFVLAGLFIDWRRSLRTLGTISLDDVAEPAAAPLPAGATHRGDEEPVLLDRLLAGADLEKALVMKLLHVEDARFSPRDLQHMASMSGRPIRDLLDGIERLRAAVRERDAEHKDLDESLQTTYAWIQHDETRLAAARHDLDVAPRGCASDLREEVASLQTRLQRRRRQQSNAVARLRRHKVTVPYKDIAVLLNTTVGNVGSRISRLREELRRESPADEGETREE